MLTSGLGWGLGIPMIKLAVSTGFHPLAVVAWQSVIVTAVLAAVLAVRGGRLPTALRHWPVFVAVAIFGTLIPNTASFIAAAKLPAGVMAIIIAMVPMFSLPIALAIGMERWQTGRALGLLFGAIAVVLLAGPERALPEGAALIFLAIALVAPCFYAVEGNWLAWKGTGGLDAIEVLWGANLFAVAVTVPWALASGEWIAATVVWDTPRWAILISSLCHAGAYAGYVWMVGRAGAVFSAQVSYVVTAAGVIWSMMLLGERYGPAVWAAFAVMMLGLALVQPREAPAERA